MRKLVLLVALLGAFAVIGAGCDSLSPYAAVVNGSRITQRDVDRELEAIRHNDTYVRAIEAGQTRVLGAGNGTFDSAFVARVLNRGISYSLVHQELGRRRVRVNGAETTAARRAVIQRLQAPQVLAAFPRWYQDKLVNRTAEVNALEQALAGPAGADAELRAYYDAHTGDFEKACVSHILSPTKEQADALVARLKGGEDFAAVARAESKDPGSAPQGGDLGCFNRDAQLVPEFLQAAFSQPVGDVGAPVQTSFGFHVIRVSSRSTPPFEAVRDDVREKLRTTNGGRINTWLEQALDKAKVKLNPKFGTFVRTGGTPTVVPPQAPAGSSDLQLPPGGVTGAPPGGVTGAPPDSAPGGIPSGTGPAGGGD